MFKAFLQLVGFGRGEAVNPQATASSDQVELGQQESPIPRKPTELPTLAGLYAAQPRDRIEEEFTVSKVLRMALIFESFILLHLIGL